MHRRSYAPAAIDPRLHHGTLNAIFLPAVISFNETAASVLDEDKLARLAQTMGLASGRPTPPPSTRRPG